MRALKKVPWIVWALIAPAVVIGAVQLWTGGGLRVPVVGAGPIHHLRAEDRPEGAHYTLDVVEHEPMERTAERAEAAIREWPDILVVALDGSGVRTGADARRACDTLDTLAQHAENATTVPVVANLAAPPGAADDARVAIEDANRCWRERVCQTPGLRLCLDLATHAGDRSALRRAVRSAVADAIARHRELRASTQVGR